MAKLAWALLFLASDLLVASTLVALLCSRPYDGAGTVEWALSRRRRRRWAVLVTLAALAYASLAPVFLCALIRVLRA